MTECHIPKSPQGGGFDFDKLGNLFVEAGAFTPPSQLHGLLCGLLCAGQRPVQTSWLESATSQMSCASELPVQVRSGLLDLYDYALADLNAESFSFCPLLPGDGVTVVQRAEALGHWCSGFVSGFGMAGISRERLSQETTDILTDLADIAQLQVDELEENEATERDLWEVYEYVRMAVLILFHEYRGKQDDAEQPRVVH